MIRPLPVREPYVTKDGGFIRELVHPLLMPGVGMSLVESEVPANGRIEPHFHITFDEVCYCLEGAGVLYVNGQAIPFFPGAYRLISKGAAHSLTATTKLRLLCICCPAYTHEDTILAG